MQEPLGANKFTVQTQGRCYETKNVWLAATDGNTYMAHRAGHHLWLMLKKLSGSGVRGGGGGGGGGGGSGMQVEDDDDDFDPFAGGGNPGSAEYKGSGPPESTVDADAGDVRSLEEIDKEMDRVSIDIGSEKKEYVTLTDEAAKREVMDRIQILEASLRSLSREYLERKAMDSSSTTPPGNTNGRAGTSGVLGAFFGGDDSSSAPRPTDDYWQWLPVITRGEKPSIKDLIGAGGVVGSVIHVGTLQRPLQGIDRPDRSYYQDAQYVAGLESSDEYVVAEQSLPCAEVLLC